MLKRTIWAVALLPLLAASPARAADEVWKCDFKGSWTKGKTAESEGEFTWKVTWTGSENKWKIAGTSEDDSGDKAKTTGTCNAKKCDIEQAYTSGEEKGNTYYWTGTYEDEETAKDDTIIEVFKGTWGNSPTDRKSGGGWKAKAICTQK